VLTKTLSPSLGRPALLNFHFGVVTADNLEQALERAGAKAGNRGFDAAMTAMEMANLLQKIETER
jgi:6,7-dimethyl-8-ribityllumazine synthase